MVESMLVTFEAAMASDSEEDLARAEMKFRKRAQKTSEIINKLMEIRKEYYERMTELESRRLQLQKERTSVKSCRPRQSGKSKVKVEMTVEQLLASLTPEQQAQLLATLQEAANAGE